MVSAAFAWLASRAKDRMTAFVCSAASVLVLCVLGGLRDWTIGTDTRLYGVLDYTKAAQSVDFADYTSRSGHESGWLMITYMCCKFLGHFNWALFFYQLITISCFYIGAYKHRKTVSLPFLLLIFCLMEYNDSYNMMRQMISAAIIFMGLDCIETKQYFKFSLYIIAGYFFHKSSLIGFPLLIGFHMLATSEKVTYSRKYKAVFAAVMVFVLMSVKPAASLYADVVAGASYYQHYENRYSDMFVPTTPVLLMAIQFLVMAFYRRNAEKIILPAGGSGVNFHMFMFLFCIIYRVAVRFVSTRVLVYYDFVSMLSMAALPRCIKNRYLRFMLFAGILSALTFYWYRFYIRGNYAQTYPYKSIL